MNVAGFGIPASSRSQGPARRQANLTWLSYRCCLASSIGSQSPVKSVKPIYNADEGWSQFRGLGSRPGSEALFISFGRECFDHISNHFTKYKKTLQVRVDDSFSNF
ncbi:hypothetical protein CEXT_409131 [Caerostris extrusa]|uniref:Uncharacterized protein n=1 Tax=Caerostris extrusa TaxID=172846 RepID=A0AAV4UWA5_CAEEX|nr:hypothetical protein CEXT_409131 [Caerostris extrusa]